MTLRTTLHANRGLSFPAILLSGVTAAFFILVTFLLVRNLHLRWSPTAENVRLLINKGKYIEALALIEKADGGDDNPRLLVEQGRALFSLALEREKRSRWKDYGVNEKDWLDSPEAHKAEKFFKNAVTHDPENIEPYYLLGLLYMEKGWFSAAENEFLAVLRRERKHVNALINLSVCYTEMKRADLAEKELRRALQLEPDNRAIAKNLTFLYRFILQKPDSAMAWANRYLNMQPQNDMDIAYVRNELVEMLQRYPEYAPREPMRWKKEPAKGRGLLKYGKEKTE